MQSVYNQIPTPLLEDAIRLALIFVFITAIFIIRTRTLNNIVKTYAFQSFFIFLIGLFLYIEQGNIILLILALLTLISKVLFIPYYINRIGKRLKLKRDIKYQYLSGTQSILLSLFVILIVYEILSTALSSTLIYKNVTKESSIFLGAVAGVSLAYIGLMIIFSRRFVITDIIGYLTMEYGFVLLGLTIADLPSIIEIFIILDVFMVTLLSAVLAFGIDSTIEDFHRNLTFRRISKKTPPKFMEEFK